MYIEIKDVIKSYGVGDSQVQVLKGIHCHIEKGEICVLLGPSGSGKSTLLNLIGGIEAIDSGNMKINQLDLATMSQKDLSQYRRNTLGFVFQFYHLVPNLTVKENIESGAYLSHNPLSVNTLLKELSLESHKNKYPHQLSGGQQQRTAIGRALAKNPQLLLCDEPTGALDYQTSKDILELIEKINEEYGTTIIIVTHNEAISKMAHRILTLKDGRILTNTINSSRINAKELEW